MSIYVNCNVCFQNAGESTHGNYHDCIQNETESTLGNYYIDAYEYTACGSYHVNTR